MEKSKVNGFTKWTNAVTEDVAPGAIPDQITYAGYTTKNLHHSEDARRAFASTIDRADKGLIHDDKGAILSALKATDEYMKLNDMHLEQGKSPDTSELEKWKQSHQDARQALHHIGEFMHHMDYWHMHEHEIQDMMSNYNPETAGAEMADSYQPQADLVEALTDKTIKPGDKIKVARVIADMLGVENAESMSPDVAVNTGLRKMKTKRITPDLIGVVKKMLALAQEVGIKVDTALIPKGAVAEAKDDTVVDTDSDYNAAKGILRFNDYAKLAKLNQGIVPVEQDNSNTVGHTLHKNDDHVRRMKVKYKTEEVELDEAVKIGSKVTVHAPGKWYHGIAGHVGEIRNGLYKGAPKTYTVYHGKNDAIQLDKKNVKLQKEAVDEIDTADYKTDKAGRKHRAHVIMFDKDKKSENMSEEVEDDLDDDELDKMADIDHEDDIIDAYDDEEFTIVDNETGEEVEDDTKVNEEVLNEVLSRMERMRARIRFMQTQSKRTRRLQFVLKRRSDSATINRRARKLAIKLMKERMMRKPLATFTVAEKERAERIIDVRKAAISRLAMKLSPRIRSIENARLSHEKVTKGNGTAGMM